MASCPRCVRPVAPDDAQCPHCGYGVAPSAARWSAVSEGDGSDAAGLIPGLTEVAAPTALAVAASPPVPSGAVSPPLGPPPVSAPPDPARRERLRRRRGIGAVAAGVAAVIAIGAFTVIRLDHRDAPLAAPAAPSSHASPTPADVTSPASSAANGPSGSASSGLATAATAHDQAVVIAGLLTHSAQARRDIGPAISDIAACSHQAAAQQALSTAAGIRAGITSALRSVDVSALPGGASAVAQLSQAMTASAHSDQLYAAWGKRTAGCHGRAPNTPELVAAQRSDTAATAAKVRFVAAWNGIARTYGLAAQSATGI